MSAPIDWRIPPSMRARLSSLPANLPVAVLLRHSVRPPLAPGDAGYDLSLTDVGFRLARELGSLLGARLRTLHASPILRCVQTAEALREGAGRVIEIRRDRLLGDPGVFVVDSALAGPMWVAAGHESVMAHLVRADSALPGLAAPDEAARFLVLHMLTAAGGEPGLHVFVTHDSLVTATAARLLGEHLGPDAWPWYLEAAFFFREGDTLHAAYRDLCRPCRTGPLCALDDRDIVELARREIGAVLGLGCSARFFLAGGAFRSLLTGRPPRDLDLWAASAADRAALIEALHRRGAQPLPPQPFADAFAVSERVVEVPHAIEPDTLEERLRRFDLGLSAVGVEHLLGDRFRPVVHPQARTSVARREVLLLKPLVNWKYALATLARLRRYAEDLGFTVPPDEEAEVWRIFDAQPAEVQRGMLDRFDRTALTGAHGDSADIRAEAVRRLRA